MADASRFTPNPLFHEPSQISAIEPSAQGALGIPVATPRVITELPLKVLKEGAILKRSNAIHRWNLRWLILTKNFIAYKETKEAKKAKIIPFIGQQVHCALVEPPHKLKRLFVFELAVAQKRLFFSGNTLEQVGEWVSAIKHRDEPPPVARALAVSAETLERLAAYSHGLPPWGTRLLRRPYVNGAENPVPYPRPEDDALLQSTQFRADNWAAAWKRALAAVTASPSDVFARAELYQIMGGFADLCKQVAVHIVREIALPVGERSVLPTADPSRFEFAGIILHICQSPDFDTSEARATSAECAVSDEIAMRIAKHDLQAQAQYIRARVPGVHVPLSCIVDYKGHRVFCMAAFCANPEERVVHGFRGGEFASNAQVEGLLRQCAQQLNLKTHCVPQTLPRPDAAQGGAARDFVRVSHSMELQAVLDAENDLFLVNLPRTLPADLPRPGTADHITRLFRPEFVRAYSEPLSSDSFADLGGEAPDSKANDSAAVRASRHLRRGLLAQFVKELDTLDPPVENAQDLLLRMHARGIPLYLAGQIAKHTALPYLRVIVEHELAARACRRVLNRSLRRLLRFYRWHGGDLYSAPTEDGGQAYVDSNMLDPESKMAYFSNRVNEAALDFFNIAFGMKEGHDTMWNDLILPLVSEHFGYELQMHTLRLQTLFVRVQELTGIVFNDHAKYDFLSGAVVRDEDLLEIQPIVHFPLSEPLTALAKVDRVATGGAFDDALSLLASTLYLNTLTRNIFHATVVPFLTKAADVMIAQGEQRLADAEKAKHEPTHVVEEPYSPPPPPPPPVPQYAPPGPPGAFGAAWPGMDGAQPGEAQAQPPQPPPTPPPTLIAEHAWIRQLPVHLLQGVIDPDIAPLLGYPTLAARADASRRAADANEDEDSALATFRLAKVYARGALGLVRRFSESGFRVYTTYMRAAHRAGAPSEALRCFQHAMEVSRWVHPTTNIAELTLRNALGALYTLDRNDRSAIEQFDEFVRSGERLLGPAHPTVAVALTKRGHCLRREGRLREAFASYDRVCSICESVFGAESDPAAYGHFFAAEALADIGDFNASIRHATAALNTRVKLFGKVHFSTMNSFFQLGLLYSRAQLYAKAVAHFEDLLFALQEVGSAESEEILASMREATTQIVKNVFLALTPQQKYVLDKVRAKNIQFSDDSGLEQVLGELLSASTPSQYVEGLVGAVAERSAFAEQKLACLVKLVESDSIKLFAPPEPEPDFATPFQSMQGFGFGFGGASGFGDASGFGGAYNPQPAVASPYGFAASPYAADAQYGAPAQPTTMDVLCNTIGPQGLGPAGAELGATGGPQPYQPYAPAAPKKRFSLFKRKPRPPAPPSFK